MKHPPSNIILSRTDSIGDVVLAMPVAKILKDNFPGIVIALLGRSYTKAIAETCVYYDMFIDVEDFLNKEITINGIKPEVLIHLNTGSKVAKRAKVLGIRLRIGSTGRLYHWLNCNKLVLLSRKNSHLHEAQLNVKLLKPLNINTKISLKKIGESYGLKKVQQLNTTYYTLINQNKFNIIIHPKSQGHAREWSIQHFIQLVNLLDADKFKIFISGTENERNSIQPLLNKIGNKAVDIVGKIALTQFISFINECDAVVANSTGPLHIAAALGKNAIGLYAPFKTKDAGRWGPIGKNAQIFTLKEFCNKCQFDEHNCSCINSIKPTEIKLALDRLYKEKFNNIKITD